MERFPNNNEQYLALQRVNQLSKLIEKEGLDSRVRQKADYSPQNAKEVRIKSKGFESDPSQRQAMVEEYLICTLIRGSHIFPRRTDQDSAWLASKYDDYFRGCDIFVDWGGVTFAVDITHSKRPDTVKEKMGVLNRNHEFGVTKPAYFSPDKVAQRSEKNMLHLTIGIDVEPVLEYFFVLVPALKSDQTTAEEREVIQGKINNIFEGLQFKVLREMNEQLVAQSVAAQRDKTAFELYSLLGTGAAGKVSEGVRRHQVTSLANIQADAEKLRQHVEDEFERFDTKRMMGSSTVANDVVFQTIVDEARAYKQQLAKENLELKNDIGNASSTKSEQHAA
jgi:hypothetical protein